jgi:hypothetical protein
MSSTTNPPTIIPANIPPPNTTAPSTVMIRNQPKHDIHKFRSVTHLTDDNWVTHKFEQIAALEERGLFAVVTGEEKEPDKKVDPDLHRLWRDKDVSAKAQIIQNLSKEVQPIVYDCSTAAEVWKALRDEFESSNLDKVANVRYTYDTLAYIEGSGMRDHINKLKILRERLGAMGDTISDTSHALRMLRLLPPSWDGVCQVLRASQPTVARVKDRLLAEEEARKTAMAYANAGTATALLSALKDPQQAASIQALISTQFGSILLNDGGRTTNGTRQANGQKQSKLKSPHLNCTNCGKRGHTKERCWAKGGGHEGRGPRVKRKDSESNSGKDRATATSGSAITEVNLADYPELVEANIAEVSSDSAFLADFNRKKPSPHEWVLDSGATTHITPHRSMFYKYNEFPNPHPIGAADHGVFTAVGIGNIWIKIIQPNAKPVLLELQNALHAPGCSNNIISVNGLTRSGNTLSFAGDSCSVFNPKGRHITQVSKQRGQLYRLSAQVLDAVPEPSLLAMQAESDDLDTWHRKLGHLSCDYIRIMQKKNLVKGLEKAQFSTQNPKCDSCPSGKQSVMPFPDKSKAIITRPLQLVCADIAGPFPSSIGGKRYMLVFIDVFSRHVWARFIKERSEAPRCLKEFIAYTERQSGHKLRTIRTDNAREFIYGEFNRICTELGIEHQTTAPYSSASNGIAERVLRTIQENGLAVLKDSNMPNGFWPEAFDYIVHSRNRSFHSGINDVPYNRWFGSPPNITNAHPFGCRVKYLNHPNIRKKGDFHSHDGRFVGYYSDSAAYKVWNPRTRQFFKTRSVIFDDSPMHIHIPSYNAHDVDDDHPVPMDISPSTSTPIPPLTPIPPATQSRPLPRPPASSNPLTRPLSPLTEIEEVSGPLPSVVNDNLGAREYRNVLTRIGDEGPYETDARGYRIRPEEHPEHPDLGSFGRIAGRSQRERRSVDRSYMADFPNWLDRIIKSKSDDDDGGFYGTMEAVLAEFNDFESSIIDPDSYQTEDYQALLAGFNVRSKPYQLYEAMRLPEPRRTAAVQAIEKEFRQLKERGVWEEVDPPQHMDTFLDCQIIVDEKHDANGDYIKTKARVVVRGDHQEEGRDFDETYTNTPSMGTVRFVLALIAALRLEPRQLDITGAYLAAPIGMDVYIRPPPQAGCAAGKVLKLKKALYGLRQAGREFTDYRDKQLRSIGYRNTPVQPSFFFRRRIDPKSPHGATLDVSVWWVDDDLAGFDDYDGTRATRCVREMASVLDIEDKGIPASFLGMAIHFNRENGHIGINQPGLIDQLVKAARLEDCKDTLTPLKFGYDIPKNTGEPHQPFHGVAYSSLIGGLIYVATATRPDIANAVRVLSSHSANPSKRAFVQLNNLIAYLKTTRDWVLGFGLPFPFSFQAACQPKTSTRRKETHQLITVFSDADWAKEPGRESISGFISFFMGSPINWTSKKQKSTVALSSMESEVISANLATREAAWLRKMLLLLDSKEDIPVNLGLDNEAAIHFANADSDQTRAKHIDTRYYYIKSKVQDNTIRPWHIRSEINPADIFTKPLRPDRHLVLMRMLGLRRLEEVCWN